MSLPKILVTGTTGKTGAVVASELLRAGYPVRAVVRTRDARSAKLQAAGAESRRPTCATPGASRTRLRTSRAPTIVRRSTRT